MLTFGSGGGEEEETMFGTKETKDTVPLMWEFTYNYHHVFVVVVHSKVWCENDERGLSPLLHNTTNIKFHYIFWRDDDVSPPPPSTWKKSKRPCHSLWTTYALLLPFNLLMLSIKYLFWINKDAKSYFLWNNLVGNKIKGGDFSPTTY